LEWVYGYMGGLGLDFGPIPCTLTLWHVNYVWATIVVV